MKKTMMILMVLAIIATHWESTAIAATPEPTTAVPIDLSFCDDILQTQHGTLCAIRPSATDARILDVYDDSGSLQDRALGFGYHLLALPDDWDQAKGLWIHFTGSYGRPYDQRKDAYESSVWLDELMGQGYIAIQLAYDNRFSVNGDLCGAQNPGRARDNCAGEVREIALSGEGASPYRSTDQYNTIDYRLEALVAYLEDTQGIQLSVGVSSDGIDWGTISVSGHSQGANQAYYIAKERAVAFACILAGGYDSADSVDPGPLAIADWFTTGASATPLSHIGALLTTTDDNYRAFHAGLTQAVGLSPDQIVIDNNAPYHDEVGQEIDGHAGTIKDPKLKTERAEACFR